MSVIGEHGGGRGSESIGDLGDGVDLVLPGHQISLLVRTELGIREGGAACARERQLTANTHLRGPPASAGPSTRSGDRATCGLRHAERYGTELRQKHGGPSDRHADGPPNSDHRTRLFRKGSAGTPALSKYQGKVLKTSSSLERSSSPNCDHRMEQTYLRDI